MTPTPEHVPPLGLNHRNRLFVFMVVVFFVAVPAMVFYAMGYRYDFSDNVNPLKTVGGLYINTPVNDSQIFIDGELVNNLRIFRSAAYIQDLEAGVHEVNVQKDGLYTWVKELPVFAHLVTEAQSFNVPIRPQVRLLTEWNNELGAGIVSPKATTTDLSFASTTNILALSTPGAATSTWDENLEYVYIVSRFASSSEEVALLREYQRLREQRFNFASEKALIGTTSTTTRRYRDSVLYEQNGEVYVTWLGEADNIPYYYCMTNKGSNLTAQLYGSHVYRQLIEQTPSTTDLLQIEEFNQRFCRDTIRIDRLQQEVQWFAFMPDSEDLVLMLLEDGLYVVEADDRAWQNTQLLYPGSNLEVLIDGGQIFVHDREYYLEVFTELDN